MAMYLTEEEQRAMRAQGKRIVCNRMVELINKQAEITTALQRASTVADEIDFAREVAECAEAVSRLARGVCEVSAISQVITKPNTEK